MNALADRWPPLSNLARVELAIAAYAVESLPRISDKLDSEIWVKRDDLTASRYGGQQGAQARVPARRGARSAVPTHWSRPVRWAVTTCLPLALYGGELGFETYAALTPQPYQRHVEESCAPTSR